MGVRAMEIAELSNDFSGFMSERLITSTIYKTSADPTKYAGNKGKLIFENDVEDERAVRLDTLCSHE